ncbi:RagB/SusD family nutrient uptake outer membrane protein [Pedobacter aquae]|uniref:RagB/SusD family nutrient uptake outer membrane protein n=2 Tax=Pedobacter aquae TaxID=2605747 RepID=A0A5C0VFW8_9SPHI|nr:RagB/SusD family nutrient uptake outer membrane protein [Pedobacter aquae]
MIKAKDMKTSIHKQRKHSLASLNMKLIIKVKLILLMIGISLSSCQDFLEAKPDKSLAVPTSLRDMNAILDNNTTNFYSFIAEVAADNFYHTEALWNAVPTERDRNIYIWENTAADGDGGTLAGRYRTIFNANIVLETLPEISIQESEREEYKRIQGFAYFARGYALLEMAQLFTEPYQESIAATAKGLPLKLSADVNEPSPRASLEETYKRIEGDLKQAAQLLPAQSSSPTRANKAAAYAVLARMYLYQRKYPQAGLYADSSLQVNNQLLDYKTINNSATPFPIFNREKLFYAYASSSNVTVARAKVDTLLYASYANGDRRKLLFFRRNADNSYAFQGSYAQSTITFAMGPTTAEMYLTRAESRARAGNKDEALQDLNTLMRNRWDNTFVPFTAANANEALRLILAERRKELIFRGLRWADLRRLNFEPEFAQVLQRKLGNRTFTLLPNDKRYVFPIPESIIQLSGIAQNDR